LRECKECSMCCAGWLPATIHNHEMFPGKPCHFISIHDKCTIYENRPDLCKEFRCVWLDNTNLPEWLKPSISNVIIHTRKTKSNIDFWEIVECGKKIDSQVLNTILLYITNNGINIRYQVDSGWYFWGSPDFSKDMKANNF